MTQADVIFVIVAYAVGINLASYMTFAKDKHAAESGQWRVPESTLLTLAAVGGTVGILIGQRLLRHKTRKQPFRALLYLLVAMQVAALAALGIYQVRAGL